MKVEEREPNEHMNLAGGSIQGKQTHSSAFFVCFVHSPRAIPPLSSAMSAPPPGSMLQAHSGLISHNTGARMPASPMPSMFAQHEEPVRHNRQQPEQSPQPPAAESARVSAGMLAPSPGGLLLSSPDVVHRGSFSSFGSSNSLSAFNGEQRKKYKIYYCLEMATVARELVSLDDRFVLAEVDWHHFPDGFPNLFIHGAESVKNYHCCFLANFHDPAVFFEQFSVITALPKLLPKSFKLFLPFFPTGTMERVSRLGEVATANTLARLLSTIPNCSKGPAQICIFDIHALQNQFYFKVSSGSRQMSEGREARERTRCLTLSVPSPSLLCRFSASAGHRVDSSGHVREFVAGSDRRVGGSRQYQYRVSRRWCRQAIRRHLCSHLSERHHLSQSARRRREARGQIEGRISCRQTLHHRRRSGAKWINHARVCKGAAAKRSQLRVSLRDACHLPQAVVSQILRR